MASTNDRFADPWGFKCNPLFDLSGDSDGNSTGDSNIIEDYVEEHLQIAGAPVNVFKLLGIHEQGLMVDLIGNGRPISSSDSVNFGAIGAFDVAECNGWKSGEKGPEVLAKSFIGYDFGVIRKCDRDVYGVEANIYYHVQNFRFKQSDNANRRVTKLRVERSMNGTTWYGVDIIDTVDDAELNEYSIKPSSKSRYWRFRPVEWNGGDNDFWEVRQIQLFDASTTRLDNMQDALGFMESRDRDYASESIGMKMHYDLLDARTELSMHGIDMSQQQFYLNVSFSSAVRLLGRPFVIGDLIEVPSEAQYNPSLNPIKKYLEVTDVSWSIDGFTPHWRPVLQRIIAEPMMASQETFDVLGGFNTTPDDTGFIDRDEPNVQDVFDVADQATNSAYQNTPERGSDTFDVATIPQDVIDQVQEDHGVDVGKLNKGQRALYTEDGLPPNGLPYTEGDEYPDSPTDGAYHRLTYTAYNDNIPPRLFRWSLVKGRWVYCETDRRAKYNRLKPSLQGNITSPTATSNDDISNTKVE